MKNKASIVSLFALIFMTTAFSASAGNIRLRIQGIKQIKGKAVVSLFNNEKVFLKEGKACRQQILPVNGSEMEIIFNDLPAGDYAVALYQDANSDGKCNLNFFGVPKEGYGFSNNYHPRICAPSFSDTKFRLDDQCSLNIKLIY